MPGEPTETFILELSASIHLLSPREEKRKFRGEELEVKSVAIDLVNRQHNEAYIKVHEL